MMGSFSGYVQKGVVCELPFSVEGYNAIKKDYDFNKEEYSIEKSVDTTLWDSSAIQPNLVYKMNPDFAKFLGYFVANGSWSINSARFTTYDESIGESYIGLVNSLFSLKVGRYSSREVDSTYCISSSVFVSYLDKDIFKSKATARFKSVPECVVKADKECIRNFLIGLFDCDSHLDRKTFVFNTASEDVGRLVHKILLGFGVVSNLRPFSGVKGYEDHTYWNVVVGGKYVTALHENIFRSDSLIYSKPKGVSKVNTNFDFIPNMMEYLIDKVASAKNVLGVKGNGMYTTEEGVIGRCKISKGFCLDIRKSCTYELLNKIIISWEDLPSDQKDAVKDIESVIKRVLQEDLYFDKIQTQ